MLISSSWSFDGHCSLLLRLTKGTLPVADSFDCLMHKAPQCIMKFAGGCTVEQLMFVVVVVVVVHCWNRRGVLSVLPDLVVLAGG